MKWACPGALAGTMVLISLVGLVACSRPAPEPRKVSPEELRSITPANAVELSQFASRLEKIVVRGETQTLEGMWLTPKDLDGCDIKRVEATHDDVLAFTEEHRKEFLELAPEHLADEYRVGRVVTTNRWEKEEPLFMQGVLAGETCAAHKFARVNVVINPKSGKADIVEHRFNALQIGGRWKLFWYLPIVNVDCDVPRTAKHYGCQQLKKSG